jgi:hypothetical protein
MLSRRVSALNTKHLAVFVPASQPFLEFCAGKKPRELEHHRLIP